MRCRHTGKVMHRTEEAAGRALAVVQHDTLVAYLCDDCQHRHLGNYSRAAGDWDRQARMDQLLGKKGAHG